MGLKGANLPCENPGVGPFLLVGKRIATSPLQASVSRPILQRCVSHTGPRPRKPKQTSSPREHSSATPSSAEHNPLRLAEAGLPQCRAWYAARELIASFFSFFCWVAKKARERLPCAPGAGVGRRVPQESFFCSCWDRAAAKTLPTLPSGSVNGRRARAGGGGCPAGFFAGATAAAPLPAPAPSSALALGTLFGRASSVSDQERPQEPPGSGPALYPLAESPLAA